VLTRVYTRRPVLLGLELMLRYKYEIIIKIINYEKEVFKLCRGIFVTGGSTYRL
jgi:hypothetical protein